MNPVFVIIFVVLLLSALLSSNLVSAGLLTIVFFLYKQVLSLSSRISDVEQQLLRKQEFESKADISEATKEPPDTSDEQCEPLEELDWQDRNAQAQHQAEQSIPLYAEQSSTDVAVHPIELPSYDVEQDINQEQSQLEPDHLDSESTETIPTPSQVEQNTDEALKPQQPNQQKLGQQKNSQQKTSQQKHSSIKKHKKPARSFMEVLLSDFGPISVGLSKLVGVYDYYQQQGKTAVFLMTVTGIALLTLGFGYLLQYSFNELLSQSFKVVIGYVFAAGTTGLGCYLYLRKPDFSEYASSLIGLGVVIAYLSSFFAYAQFGLFSNFGSLIALVLVTGVAYALSLRFETKIVSSLTLIGGLLVPALLLPVNAFGIGLVAYLMLIFIALLHLSKKVQWPALAQAAFAFSVATLEYCGLSDLATVPALLLIVAFHWVNIYFWSFDGLALKSKATKINISILIANAFYLIYSLLAFDQFELQSLLVGAVFFVSGILLLWVFRVLKIHKSEFAAIYGLLITLYFAGAVLMLVPGDTREIIWGLEGLAIIYAGYRYQSVSIRLEGAVLFVVAVAALVFYTLADLNHAFVLKHTDTWLYALAASGLLIAMNQMAKRATSIRSTLETKLVVLFAEASNTWILVLSLLASQAFFSDYLLTLQALPLLYLMRASFKHQLQWSGLLSVLIWLAMTVSLWWQSIDSVHFTINDKSTYLISCWMVWFAVSLSAAKLFLRCDTNNYTETSYGSVSWLYDATHIMRFCSMSFVPAWLAINTIVILGQGYADGFVNNPQWRELVLLGLVSVILLRLFNSSLFEQDNRRALYQLMTKESLMVLLGIFFFYSLAIAMPLYWKLAAWLPMVVLLYIGITKHQKVTEIAGWSCIGILVAQVVLSGIELGTFRLSQQSWVTHVAWVELFLCGWSVQWLYEKIADKTHSKNGRGYKFAQIMRLAVYVALPLVFLPKVWRNYNEYFAAALWLSTAMAWLLHKRIGHAALLVEFKLLNLAAIIAGVLYLINDVSLSTSFSSLASGGAALMLFTISMLLEKPYSKRHWNQSSYQLFFIATFYYLVVCLFAAVALWSNSIQLALVMAALCLFGSVYRTPLIAFMRPTLKAASLLCFMLCGLSILSIVKASVLGASSLDVARSGLAFISAIITLFMMAYLTHPMSPKRNIYQRLVMPAFSSQRIRIWIFHGFVSLAYLSLIKFFDHNSFAIVSSVAMLVHAMFVLFMTLRHTYQDMIYLPSTIFACTALKVIVLDLDGYSMVHKVIAFMTMGIILLAGAYGYQRLKVKH